jgi:hypothetical protein
LALAGFYQSSYGYQLQPGEPSGPLGTMGDLIGVLLLLFGFLLLLGYALVLFVYGTFRFFRWLGEEVPNQSSIDI